eukprot:TRINITY_DN4172_c0_g2_i1.p1 TRINITY_DN4172_c0_g2~~TRINITY_DN4172_c0_g2_i1.p1  ORF type:complete len:305 (-),score=77.88 TRINITY_DN4172_c0_g2_i1:36-950(-)
MTSKKRNKTKTRDYDIELNNGKQILNDMIDHIVATGDKTLKRDTVHLIREIQHTFVNFYYPSESRSAHHMRGRNLRRANSFNELTESHEYHSVSELELGDDDIEVIRGENGDRPRSSRRRKEERPKSERFEKFLSVDKGVKENNTAEEKRKDNKTSETGKKRKSEPKKEKLNQSGTTFLATNLGYESEDESEPYVVRVLRVHTRDDKSGEFDVMEIHVHKNNRDWTIFRRWKSVQSLDKKLKKKGLLSPGIFMIKPKKNEKVIEKLQTYFDEILSDDEIASSKKVFNFLGPFQIGDIKPNVSTS